MDEVDVIEIGVRPTTAIMILEASLRLPKIGEQRFERFGRGYADNVHRGMTPSTERLSAAYRNARPLYSLPVRRSRRHF